MLRTFDWCQAANRIKPQEILILLVFSGALATNFSPRTQFDPPRGVLSQLTTERIVGNIANMPAQLITGFKNANPDGSVLELVVWRVPKPVPPSTHVYKY
jgi:hypothetical protein